MVELPNNFDPVRRLEELARGVSKEIQMWERGGADLLLDLERRAYVNALHDGLSALEEARVVLARAGRRVAASDGA